jgi:hypothetical protein
MEQAADAPSLSAAALAKAAAGFLRLFEELARDDETLDLGRPLVDPQGANLAVEAFDDRAALDA